MLSTRKRSRHNLADVVALEVKLVKPTGISIPAQRAIGRSASHAVCSVFSAELPFTVSVPDGVVAEVALMSNREDEDVLQPDDDLLENAVITGLPSSGVVMGPVSACACSVKWTSLVTSQRFGMDPRHKPKKKTTIGRGPVLFAIGLCVRREQSSSSVEECVRSDPFFLVSNTRDKKYGSLVKWVRPRYPDLLQKIGLMGPMAPLEFPELDSSPDNALETPDEDVMPSGSSEEPANRHDSNSLSSLTPFDSELRDLNLGIAPVLSPPLSPPPPRQMGKVRSAELIIRRSNGDWKGVSETTQSLRGEFDLGVRLHGAGSVDVKIVLREPEDQIFEYPLLNLDLSSSATKSMTVFCLPRPRTPGEYLLHVSGSNSFESKRSFFWTNETK